MSPKSPAPIVQTTTDVAEELRFLMGDMGGLNETMGGYRIKVYHTRAFPWDEVFKLLLFRGFRVYVTNHKADIYIEAMP
jgi:hypothetical protein